MDIREQTQRLYAAIDAQDWVRVREMTAPDLVIHLASAGPHGLDQWREVLEGLFVAFPDGHHVLDDIIVEGDRAATRCRFKGTQTGTFRGAPPSGNAVSVGVIHIDRFAGGKVVEHFGQLDALGLLQQIGAAPR
jgi:predicted ester cyclase